MQTVVLNVQEMSCQNCVQAVQNALTKQAGVSKVEVDLAAGQARVAYDEKQSSVNDLGAAVEAAGFVFAGAAD